MMFINFSDIPNHQNLFLDYLYEFNNVKEFYQNDFRNKDNYLRVFKNVSESKDDILKKVSNIIKKQYSGFESSDVTVKNIESLSDKRTLTIVTGQQLGIFGGPLYTFYKIITAIKLSKHLSERYDEYNFVPVFWLEGDDHDFNEVRSIKVINDNNNLVTIGYAEEISEDDAKESVGFIKFNNGLNNFFNELNSNLRDTEFKEPILEKIKNFYSEGSTFKESFKNLIHWIFDEYGLVIFDPQGKEIKELLKPVFKKEINDFRQHTQELVHISAKLEELYHAQVKVKPVNLFLSVENGRYSIEPVENEFKLRRKRKSFSLEQLLEIVDNEPARFSPNVLLRPICQDFLLPTAFYIAGPSEISYFAQLKPLYSFYNITQPIIYPRCSATILEGNISKILSKHDITITELFMDGDFVKKRILDSLSEVTLEELFSKVNNDIEIAFDQLRERLFQLDKTISDSSKRYKEKIFQALNELKLKAEQAQQKKHEATLRQIDRASVNLYPMKNLQERELNFIHFANKYGMDFIKTIFKEIQINKFEHQIIEI
jgi:bacillithiol synthase